MSKDHGVIFSPPMVKALIAGRKSQTRRILGQNLLFAPKHRIWVREGWAVGKCADGLKPGELSPGCWRHDNGGCWYRADDHTPRHPISPRGRWRVAIFLPRWASRITLTITDVRVQKLQEITEEDAIAEGLIKAAGRYVVEQGQQYFGGNYSTARQCYSHLWDSLHGDPGKRWKDNPFVVALTFSVELRNIDFPALEPARQQVPA